MKIAPDIYAKALWDVLAKTPKGKEDEVIGRFVRTVQKRSDFGAMDKIVDAVHTRAVWYRGGRRIVVAVARKQSPQAIDQITKYLSSKDSVRITEDPSLVAGARITIDNNRELDYSLQRKLKKMFHN